MVQENTVSDKAIWKVRPYGEAVGDYQMISAWREGHKVSPLPETIIPPLALIAEREGEPQSFAVCYQSCGIGVCFLEWLITRPGLTALQAREALGHVIGGIEACAKANDYGLMFGYAPGNIARESKRFGFQVTSMPHMQVIKRIDL
jgi:hypothetical protein